MGTTEINSNSCGLPALWCLQGVAALASITVQKIYLNFSCNKAYLIDILVLSLIFLVLLKLSLPIF